MLGANVMWGLMSPVAKMVFAAGVVAPMVMVDFRVAGAAALFWLTSLFLPREHVPLGDIRGCRKTSTIRYLKNKEQKPQLSQAEAFLCP